MVLPPAHHMGQHKNWLCADHPWTFIIIKAATIGSRQRWHGRGPNLPLPWVFQAISWYVIWTIYKNYTPIYPSI